MSTRRALLAVPAAAFAGKINHLVSEQMVASTNRHRAYKHSDAALLALCAQLEEMQTEWQRLYDATSDEDEITTAADRAWQDYSDHVWPLVHSNSAGAFDLPAKLLAMPATTPEGVRAKAAAVLAIEDAAAYCDDRDDGRELILSVLRDLVGTAYRSPGAPKPHYVA